MTHATKKVTLARTVAGERYTHNLANTTATQAHAALQQSDALTGERATYTPRTKDGIRLPPENKRVRVVAAQLLRQVTDAWARSVDVAATRDYGNCQPNARADVYDAHGAVLVKDAPITFLVWLEARLRVWRNFAENLPVLPDKENWVREKGGVWETEPFEEVHARDVPHSKIIAPATPEHPAQVHVWNEEEILGYWEMVNYSGALPAEYVQGILDRIDELNMAVKDALSRANTAEVEQQRMGEEILTYLFRV